MVLDAIEDVIVGLTDTYAYQAEPRYLEPRRAGRTR
jgi:hypothetical protein